MASVKIFVSTRSDQECTFISSPIYYPIRCGAVFDHENLNQIPGDDLGDNISYKKQRYNELTVLYWAWKNSTADYVGLCHYRRYFSFSKNRFKEDIYGNIICDYLDSNTIETFVMNDTLLISQTIEQYDMILSQAYNVRKAGFKNIYQQYEQAGYLHVEDLYCILNLIKTQSPQYYETAQKYLDSIHFYPCNMFIMKNDVFNRYCQWLFPLLFSLEKEIRFENYSIEGQRTIGMIAERLLGIFCLYETQKNKLRLHILQRIFIKNTEPMKIPDPFFTINNVPVLFASSETFAPYLSVTIKSVMHHASNDKNYDLIVLHSGITHETQNKMQEELQHLPNAKLRFYDVSQTVSALKLQVNDHVEKESYYRLLALKILIHYDKVIYLDGDLIANCDISQLLLTDMEDNLIAAVRDVDFIGQYCGANIQMRNYVRDKLCLDNPLNYFQAGVLVMNIQALAHTFGEDELIYFATAHNFQYCDQDVLNCKCAGRISFLDPAWNVLVDCGGMRLKNIRGFAPGWLYEQYSKARKAPKIIHYAGYEKPWLNPGMDMAQYFNQIARKSLFYEEIIYNYSRRAHRKITHIFKQYAKKILPPNTRRRNLVVKVCYMIKRK